MVASKYALDYYIEALNSIDLARGLGKKKSYSFMGLNRWVEPCAISILASPIC
jgi:hypothetical protein